MSKEKQKGRKLREFNIGWFIALKSSTNQGDVSKKRKIRNKQWDAHKPIRQQQQQQQQQKHTHTQKPQETCKTNTTTISKTHTQKKRRKHKKTYNKTPSLNDKEHQQDQAHAT